MTASLVPWTAEEVARFGLAPMKARHRLDESALFEDEALVELLDRMPADQVHAYTMGDDPADNSQWRAVRHAGVAGADLLRAVQRGRLWLNVVRVQEVDTRFEALVEAAYADLAEVVPGFTPTSVSTTLLISSPSAFVHFHADGQPNLLWHLRGHKRLWVYPELDERFLSRADLQRIFAGEADEFVPYQPGWDAHATVLDLAPGDVAGWPQNAPHRVANLDGVNVSLSTEHRTPTSTRREHVWAANAALTRLLHVPVRSTVEDGPWATTKAACYRVLHRISGSRPVRRPATVVLRMDPAAPLGHTLTHG